MGAGGWEEGGEGLVAEGHGRKQKEEVGAGGGGTGTGLACFPRGTPSGTGLGEEGGDVGVVGCVVAVTGVAVALGVPCPRSLPDQYCEEEQGVQCGEREAGIPCTPLPHTTSQALAGRPPRPHALSPGQSHGCSPRSGYVPR